MRSTSVRLINIRLPPRRLIHSAQSSSCGMVAVRSDCHLTLSDDQITFTVTSAVAVRHGTGMDPPVWYFTMGPVRILSFTGPHLQKYQWIDNTSVCYNDT
ncbi:unnamed protein product [Aspergillus oryzae]|uniref:Unnamed protein product n=1 Tax=Aspergillus oryzae TaxID=5062 RepID=A0AAN5BRH9_ASPOZ|nr:unnamed protein product [Aspergillus oryzae]